MFDTVQSDAAAATNPNTARTLRSGMTQLAKQIGQTYYNLGCVHFLFFHRMQTPEIDVMMVLVWCGSYAHETARRAYSDALDAYKQAVRCPLLSRSLPSLCLLLC